MSLAVDASSPTAAIGSGASTVTSAFTPPDNTLLVAYCQGDANNGSLDEDQTVVDSTSTTWTKKILRNGNGGAVVTVHYRRIVGTSPGSITATLTDNKGSVAKRIFVRVYIDAATGIAPDIGATAVSGATTVSLVTTVNNAWVWSACLTANATLTAGSGCTLQDSFGGFDSGDAVATYSQTSLTATAGTNVTDTIAGTATVPHNVAVEIIPGSASTASATTEPLVVSPTTRPAPTTPILLRATLQDPPVLTTPGPLVVTSTRPVLIPRPLTLRATLQDPPQLTTPAPYVVSQPARPAPGQAILSRSSLADVVVITGVSTPGPLVVGPAYKPAPVPPVLLGRSTLADPTPQTTPGPYVVSRVARPAPTGVLLLRGSLFDPTTPGPYVVSTAARAPVYQPILLRSSLAAPVVVEGVSTPQPYVVSRQPAPIRTMALVLAGPAATGVCDCTTHRPSAGTTTRPSSGITLRPDTGITARPCTC